MTEDELLRAVSRLCEERLLHWTHNPDSRRALGHKGFPDLVIAGQRGTIFAELKNDRTTLTADQRRWGSMLHPRWTVWRPRDLQAGVIQTALDDIARWHQEIL